MNIRYLRICTFLAVLALLLVYVTKDFQSYLTLEHLKTSRDGLVAFRENNPFGAIALYFTIYAIVTALSVPGATLLTLAGGAIFGLGTGLLVVSFASTLGATLAFLISRYLLRDFVQRRFGDKLRSINEGIEKEGAFYLFTLRLTPVFPFFLINLTLGLTPIKTRVYWWVSQVGMLPGTLVYVNAGTQLAKLESLKGILSPELILSFMILGIFPLLAKKTLPLLKKRTRHG